MEREFLRAPDQPPPAKSHPVYVITPELGLQRASDDSQIGSAGSIHIEGSSILRVQILLRSDLNLHGMVQLAA